MAAVVIAACALPLLASCSHDAPGRDQWLSLPEAGHPIECEGRLADWRSLPGPELSVFGFRQAPSAACRFAVRVPDRSVLGFRVSLAGENQQPLRRSASVRITARQADAGEAAIVFEADLNASHPFAQSAALLPAGSLEIELHSLSPAAGGPTAHIDWSSLVIRTSDADFEGAAPWAIHARYALAPYFAENPAPAATPGKRRMLIVGIDGASWDLLTPLLEAGELPALASLKNRGRWGQLNSTVIPESAMAWTAISTGVNAGKNGVFSFLSPATTRRAFWHTLGDHGLRSLIIAVPKALASQPLNGVIIGGWTYKMSSSFVYPPDLQPHVLRAGYRPGLRFCRNVDYYRERMRRRTELTLALMAYEDWDLTFVVYEYSDTAAHKFGLAAPEWAETYRAVDVQLAQILEAAGEDTNVLLISDHGWKTYDHTFNMAPWLASTGYSRYIPNFDSGSVITVYEGRRADGTPLMSKEELKVSFGRIERDLRRIRIPGSQQRLVQRVRDLPTAFPGPFSHELSNNGRNKLVVEVREDYRLLRGEDAAPIFADTPADQHSLEGIYLLAGPGIEPGHGPDQSVVDVAATVLKFFGVGSQSDADGEPMDDFGHGALLASPGPAFFRDANAGVVPQENPKDDEKLAEKLRSLGYID